MKRIIEGLFAVKITRTDGTWFPASNGSGGVATFYRQKDARVFRKSLSQHIDRQHLKVVPMTIAIEVEE